jgi:hypothetical protein
MACSIKAAYGITNISDDSKDIKSRLGDEKPIASPTRFPDDNRDYVRNSNTGRLALAPPKHRKEVVYDPQQKGMVVQTGEYPQPVMTRPAMPSEYEYVNFEPTDSVPNQASVSHMVSQHKHKLMGSGSGSGSGCGVNVPSKKKIGKIVLDSEMKMLIAYMMSTVALMFIVDLLVSLGKK